MHLHVTSCSLGQIIKRATAEWKCRTQSDETKCASFCETDENRLKLPKAVYNLWPEELGLERRMHTAGHGLFPVVMRIEMRINNCPRISLT